MAIPKQVRVWISSKIKKLRDEGKPLDQCVAIAYSMAGDKWPQYKEALGKKGNGKDG